MSRRASHQVTDVYDARDFAAGRRGLPGCADRIVDCDGDSGSLLADGATDERVARSDCGKGPKLKTSPQNSLINILASCLVKTCLEIHYQC